MDCFQTAPTSNTKSYVNSHNLLDNYRSCIIDFHTLLCYTQTLKIMKIKLICFVDGYMMLM